MIKAIYILFALLPALLLHSAVATDLSEHFVTFPGARDVGGAFVWKAFPPTHKTNQIRPRDPNGEDTNPVVTFCGDGTQASTRNYNSEVYFCEAGLDIDTTLGPNYPITAGQGLPETTSSIWVHELVHVNTPITDLPAARTDSNGNIIRSGKAYGFEDIANLARLVPADVITTADSYALYAVGLRLTEWDFADAKNAGKAIKMLGP